MLQGQDLAERMELAINAARLGVCDWDIIAQKITWNDYHVRLLDYIPGAAEYTYEDWVRRVHPEDLDRVNAAVQGKMWEFNVADDGSGIAAEDRDRVFATFQTLGARDKPENTGIGLSIVKKIIESHDGNISIVERPSASFKFQLNRGTIFRFTWLTAE